VGNVTTYYKLKTAGSGEVLNRGNHEIFINPDHLLLKSNLNYTNMFLDDELLKACKEFGIAADKDSLQELNEKLCTICENYYKPQITVGMSKKEVKVILDRTFNAWDSFVRMLIKEGDFNAILGELFHSYSFKRQFLSNEALRKLYDNL
jgi:hypothetical protein